MTDALCGDVAVRKAIEEARRRASLATASRGLRSEAAAHAAELSLRDFVLASVSAPFNLGVALGEEMSSGVGRASPVGPRSGRELTTGASDFDAPRVLATPRHPMVPISERPKAGSTGNSCAGSCPTAAEVVSVAVWVLLRCAEVLSVEDVLALLRPVAVTTAPTVAVSAQVVPAMLEPYKTNALLLVAVDHVTLTEMAEAGYVS